MDNETYDDSIIQGAITQDCPLKIFRDEKNMNPSNWTIYLDINKIPVNIKKENISGLKYRLQKLMPLSKKIHLTLLSSTPREITEENTFNIKSSLKIQNKRVEIK